ncbi:MAG: Sapep family Mn(2+)-dependent dipeptidase [Eggerthellaceae bacterium]
MLDPRLNDELEAYLDRNWETMLSELDRLVRIESVEDRSQACEGAPYGPGPARALEEALALWGSYGFQAHDCAGHVGYADWPGESPVQIGIIGHVDVVPAGQGWSFPPFQVTRRDGFLLGRGVSDDKGPMLMALHAARFWMEKGRKFPYTLRFIIGNNEETGMHDLEYYQERFEDPELLFSPDDEFPVCYGEKGVFQGVVKSAPIETGRILEWEAGMAVNAVPGTARAVLSCAIADLGEIPPCIHATEREDGTVELFASGVQAHASTPEEGESALAHLADFLLHEGILEGAELDWMELVHDVCSNFDGSGLGLECEDGDFGSLTLVGGVAGFADGRFTQTIDIRFGSGASPESLTEAIGDRASCCGACFELLHCMPLFAQDKDGDLVQTLLGSYRDVTGDMQEPFTIGGATYSRHFKAGVGFGVDVHGQSRPSWVGSMHAADEGVSEEALKNAFKVYAVAIERLMGLEIGS